MKMNDRRGNSAGFTLIEIMAAAAIAAASIAAIVVATVKAQHRSAIRDVPTLVQQVQTALVTYTQKVGGSPYPPITNAPATSSIPTTGALLGAAAPATVSAAATIDNVLLTEGVMEKAIHLAIGSANNTPAGAGTAPLLWNTTTNTFYCNPDAAPNQDFTLVPRVICSLSTANVPGTDGTNYYTANSGTSLPANTRVVTLVIPGVSATDAADCANFVNNTSTATSSAANTLGRVTYAAPNAAGQVTLYCLVATY